MPEHDDDILIVKVHRRWHVWNPALVLNHNAFVVQGFARTRSRKRRRVSRFVRVEWPGMVFKFNNDQPRGTSRNDLIPLLRSLAAINDFTELALGHRGPAVFICSAKSRSGEEHRHEIILMASKGR